MQAKIGLVGVLLLALALAGCTGPAPAPDGGNGTTPTPTPTPSPNPSTAGGPTHVLMNTSMGDIRLLLHTDTTPITAGSFVNLTKQGYFDGQRFHRVIGPAKSPPAGFMDQAGDPNSKDPAKKASWGTGGPGYTIADEFACKDGTVSSTWTGAGKDPCASHGGLRYHFDHAGVMAMANTGSAHSGGSQFFLTMAAASFLDGGYPIFGEAEDPASVAVIKAIGNVPTDSGDRPITDVLIHKVTVVG